MSPGLVMWPVAILEYLKSIALQDLTTGQPVRIIPHLETTQEACQRVRFDMLRTETHFRLESESTARIPHRAMAHAHDSPHRS